MFILNSLIEIEKLDGRILQIKNPVDISIESTYLTLTDTATITLPNRFKIDGEENLTTAFDRGYSISGENALFNIGDKVNIYLEYIGQQPSISSGLAKPIYEGFIREINNDSPIILKLEDYTHLLKKTRSLISLENATVRDIITELLKKGGWSSNGVNPVTGNDSFSNTIQGVPRIIEVEYTDPNFRYGKLRVSGNKPTIASVLDTMRVFKFYFRRNTLNVTLPQTQTIADAVEHEINYETRIIDHNLFYQRADDKIYKLIAKSFQSNNEYREVEVGDPEGETRTYFAEYGLSEADLTKVANEKLKEIKQTGFKGSFVTFGDPIIKHLDIVNITRTKFPNDGIGRYRVEKVNTSFGQGGFRQEIQLGSQLDS